MKNKIEKITECLLHDSMMNSERPDVPDRNGIDRICKIHNLILLLMKHKKFLTIDILLEIIDPMNISIDDMLSILTATNWCAKELKNRKRFFKACCKRCDYEHGLLDGLE